MNAVRARRPVWRRAVAYGANAYRLVFLHGLQSWRRDLRRTAPAVSSIALVLVLAGVLSVLGVAVANVVAAQAADASLVSVYLAPNASQSEISALTARLAADPRVASVTLVTSEEAMRRARSRPGLGDLAQLADSNPFPASLDVRVRLISNVGAVAGSAAGDPAVDRQYPTSYDPDAYAGLRNLAVVLGGVAVVVVALLTFISYAVCANSLRAIAISRRDELVLTRLLGARRWMLRGPFVVEGLMTGAVAGLIAVAVMFAGWWAATATAAGVYSAVLPGVDLRAVQLVMAAVLTGGLLVGSVSAAFGVRRLTA